MIKTSIARRVEKNEKQYRFLTRWILDSLWVIDAEAMRVLFISESSEKVRGFPPKEIIGREVKSIMTPGSYREAMEVFKKARQDYEQGKDPSYKLEIECYHKNSTTVWVEIWAKFVREEGEPLQIVGISREITDRKVAEINREHMLKMYKEALVEQKQLRSEIELYEKLLPICTGCRRIRDDNDNWWPIEEYIRKKTGAKVAHTVCPDCVKILNPDDADETEAS